MDEITLQLNSPLTDEQWDTITDVDFDHTDRITFHTKHGKEVDFVKFKPIKTNADKYFRNATDDMIAEWIAKHMYCVECMFFNDDNGTCKYEQRYRKGCNGAMLDWLKQEVESDE